MPLGHLQQICSHKDCNGSHVDVQSVLRRKKTCFFTHSVQELTLVPTMRAREACYGESHAKPTHGCTSSFTKGKISKAVTCFKHTWRQKRMCPASQQTWRRNTTRQGKGCAKNPLSLSNQPEDCKGAKVQSKTDIFSDYRLAVPTVLAATRVESEISPTHIAHPGREQGLYICGCDDSLCGRIYSFIYS